MNDKIKKWTVQKMIARWKNMYTFQIEEIWAASFGYQKKAVHTTWRKKK